MQRDGSSASLVGESRRSAATRDVGHGDIPPRAVYRADRHDLNECRGSIALEREFGDRTESAEAKTCPRLFERQAG